MFDALVWGGFGLIFGSFTNVLILREGTGQGLSGRSACPQCGTTLHWFELIPVLSWIALRGKCRTCRRAISPQYPLVEIIVSGLFVLIGLAPALLVVRILGALMSIFLVAIGVFDLRHRLMPDIWVYGFVACAFFLGALMMYPDITNIIRFLFSGPAVALPLFLLWYFSDGRWMGFGDVKFALGIGWLVGMVLGYVALCIAFVVGALVGIFILLPLPRILAFLRRHGITRFQAGGAGYTMKSEVPFGPFLILAVCIVWICQLYSLPLLAVSAGFLSLN